MSVDPAIQFPGESREYRLARNQLLEAEIELRRPAVPSRTTTSSRRRPVRAAK